MSTPIVTLEPEMKKLLVVIAILCSGGCSEKKTDYAIATVSTNPVPKGDLVLLWKDVALKMCARAPEEYATSSKKCITSVEVRSEQCGAEAGATIPQIVDSQASSKRLGKAYLRCVLPGVVCNGVEVRTEAEARAANCD